MGIIPMGGGLKTELISYFLGKKKKKSNIPISKTSMDFVNKLALLCMFAMSEVHTSSCQMKSFVIKWFIKPNLKVNIHNSSCLRKYGFLVHAEELDFLSCLMGGLG